MRYRFIIIALCSILITVGIDAKVGMAQIPFLPQIQTPSLDIKDLENKVVSGWVYLDGRRLFQIAAPRGSISERLQNINQKLAKISKNYLRSDNAKLNIEARTQNGLPVIYVNDQYLLTVTQEDAKLRQVEPQILAESLKQDIKDSLEQAKLERQPEFLIDRSKIATAVFGGMILMSWGVRRLSYRSKRNFMVRPPTSDIRVDKPITTQLSHQQNRHILEVKRRFFQLTQAVIWTGGTLFMLSLFPYTRAIEVGIIAVLRIPLRLSVVGVGTYVAIRLTYLLIDRFTTAFVRSSTLITPETSERLQLRVSTISGVSKGIITLLWLAIGVLVALTALGIDIVPLLAGASLIGVALSLASQSLIKDAINGFLIIVEDQYALGDVINVGDVGGLVENLNLRITQLRDAEGRLITIPNSEIKIVANLSSRWSRADLTIPIAYQTSIDQALELIETVGLEMDKDARWEHQIIEPPDVLGIDNFGDRGLIIRVWIKTQPLKQWDVAREYRHRLKVAFDKAGISIPVQQQSVWLNSMNN
ncbi:mechanosensitive ion channel family protein [Rivularia sp. UHCC 0363]|uniref:mechanosensitive ion channel family protein n=1 Tax=Rivularia sp. UHCC 0363 TaxID=3110244 RepID=UPI002B1EB706|nr:mechanosensitive ion channel family protein [Rivularia sp. UHCC 0363]MEA5593502.1 mechanosensitive ion channel family protein [Rivularia sp. UHCC 0363]